MARADPLTLSSVAPLACLWLVLLLPWLNPFVAGPTASVVPWLIAAACMVLVAHFRNRLTPGTVAQTWLVAALLSALFGLLQYAGLAHALHPWVHSAEPGEAFANLRQRNQFATLTSIGLLSSLWLGGRSGPVALRTAPLAVAAVVLALGNAASGSRTGLVQWILVVLAALAWPQRLARPRPVVWIGLTALLAYAVAVVALPGLSAWATGVQGGSVLARLGESDGCSSRRILWSNVIYLIGQKPWLGWGWGELDYAHFTTLYPGERFCEILDNAHNLPLHLAVELGLPFAVGVCGLGLWLAWRARPWAETDPTRQLAWGVLAVIALHSLLEYPLWYGPFQLAVALALWLLWPRPSLVAPAPELDQNPGLAPVISTFAATFLLATLAFAAWDYHRISQIYLAAGQRDPAYRDNTLAKIRNSRLFADQVRFAELTTTPLTRNNAASINAMAHSVLHFSPEARVAEKLIESAVMLGRDDEALFFLQRLKAAYPAEHARWAKANASAAASGP